MSKITRLQADNFKKLTVIDIRPGAGMVPIRGRNAQGKSSTLDAIMAALGGKSVMPSKPVRRGEDEGSIRVELDDGVVILRRFTQDGKGDSIEVTNAEGFRAPSPQKMLDGLYASVAFDPLAFTRLEAPKQLLRVRSLVKLDVDVDALERSNVTDYDKRRDLNRDLKTAESTLLQMPKHLTVPAEPVDEAALEQAIAGASEVNSQIERRKVNREAFIAAMERNRLTWMGLKDKAAALRAEAEEVDRQVAEFEEQYTSDGRKLAEADPLPDPVDISEAQAALREARVLNGHIAANQRYGVQEMLVASLRSQVADLSTAMETRKTTIADAIERANMPVPGLGFGDGEVLFNGLPLDQASSAEQLRVSTAIGMATSPKLRVMLVRDGSLLDDEGEKILASLAEENDFQLWVEAVDTSGKVGIVLEDGAVVSIDGEPAPEPEAIAGPKRRKKTPDPKPTDETKEIGQEPQKSADEAPDTQSEEITDPNAGLVPYIEYDPDADQDGDVQPEADRDPDDVPWVQDDITEPEPEHAKPAKAAPVGLFD